MLAGIILVAALALTGCGRAAHPDADPAPPVSGPDHPPRLGQLRTYATLHSIGIEWSTEQRGAVRVRFREEGNGNWQEGYPLYRIDYEPPIPRGDGRKDPFNGFAGSVMFLEPGQAYEVWLTLTDESGNLVDEGVVRVSTRTEPSIPEGAPRYHVVPGNGGGTGTEDDPYRGIAEAQDHAQPGDVFLLHAGEYQGFKNGEIFLSKPGEEGRWIVWKAAEDGVVFTDMVRVAASYIWIEGVHLRGDPNVEKQYGIKAYYGLQKRVVIKKNLLTDFYHGIEVYKGEGWVITDNVIVGDKDLRECLGPDDEEIHDDNGCPAVTYTGEGIELFWTPGHTVAYNDISLTGDGISYPLENVDIFGNEIHDTTDDGIEGDYGYANVRIWQNRITNARHHGISFQPMNGGPWYVLRNQVATVRESAMKVKAPLTRALVAHNLFLGWKNVITAQGYLGMQVLDSLNNVYVSVDGRYIWEHYKDQGIVSTLDYDGFDWGGAPRAFQFGIHRYVDLAELQADKNVELHGVVFDRNDCFETWNPKRPPEQVPLEYLSLKAGCPLVDAGTPLPNVGGAYSGSAPDLGPYERGQPLPHYGPRP